MSDSTVRSTTEQVRDQMRDGRDNAVGPPGARSGQGGVDPEGSPGGGRAGLFGTAAALGLASLGALTACIILALNAVLPAWLAALIVAAVFGVVAAVLA
ncbi:MAG TPA: phage holin family protein, partial [Actinomycetes bacterium]|nr:phage holin family protein [Actinomycetes bacterium]